MFWSVTNRFAVFASLSFLLLAFTGCRLINGYGSDEGPVSVNNLSTSGVANLRIVFAGASDTLPLELKPSTSVDQEPRGEISITVVKPGDLPQQHTLSQKILIESASTNFEAKGIPALPSMVEVKLINASCGGRTEFRGAADLVRGENIIFVNPKDSGLTYDLAAAVMQEIIQRPELIKHSETRLVTDILYCLPFKTTDTLATPSLAATIASVTTFLSTQASNASTPVFENATGDLASPTKQISLSLREAFLSAVNGLRANILSQEETENEVVLNQLRNAFAQIRRKLVRQPQILRSIQANISGDGKNLPITLPGGKDAIDGPEMKELYDEAKYTATELVASGNSSRYTVRGAQVTADTDGVINKIILTGGTTLQIDTIDKNENSSYFIRFNPGVKIDLLYTRLPNTGFFKLQEYGNTEIGALDGFLGTETVTIQASSNCFGFTCEYVDHKDSSNNIRFGLSLAGIAGQVSFNSQKITGRPAKKIDGVLSIDSNSFSKYLCQGTDKTERNISFPGNALTLNLSLDIQTKDMQENLRVKRLWINLPGPRPLTGIMSGYAPFAGIELKELSGGAEFDFGNTPPEEIAYVREYAISFNSLSLIDNTENIKDGANLYVTKHCRDGNQFNYHFRSFNNSWKLVSAPPSNTFRGGSESAEQINSLVFPGHGAWKFTGTKRFRSLDAKELVISYQTILEYDNSAAAVVNASFEGVVHSIFMALDQEKQTVKGKYYKDLRQNDDGVNLHTIFDGNFVRRGGNFTNKYVPGMTQQEISTYNLNL